MRRRPSDILAGVESQLMRIADTLDILAEISNPLRPLEQALPEDEKTIRAFYTDEHQQLINEYLRRMGKEPKNL